MRFGRRLIRAIEARGGSVSTAGSRNLLSRLAIDLGMIGAEEEIEATLLALAEKGHVRIRRMAGDNSPIRSVSIVKTSATKPKVKHAQPPEPIPVVVIEDNREEEVAVGDNNPEPLHTRLTNTLVALQVNADSDGFVKANSLTALVAQELHVSESQAKDLLTRLHRLDLKESLMTGGGKYRHRVRMDVHEVTEEMVAVTRVKKPVSIVPPQAEPSTPAEIAEGEVVAELLVIIERLESELAESAASLQRGLEVVERLQAEKARLERVVSRGDDLLLARDSLIAELREQLAAKAAPTAKAAEVIRRYRTKS